MSKSLTYLVKISIVTFSTKIYINLIVKFQPTKKMPGDSHIRNMHRDLRLYVMREMSLEKTSGKSCYSPLISLPVHFKLKMYIYHQYYIS